MQLKSRLQFIPNNPVKKCFLLEPRTKRFLGFSKKFDSNFNPNSDFAAILTCSSADKECPYIANAKARIPVTYDDPKAFDGTPQQVEKYMERSLHIATELKFVFSTIKL